MRRAHGVKSEPTAYPYEKRLAAVQAPILLPSEAPTPPPKPRMRIVKRYVGNCVATLKASGDLPKGKVTKNGTAGSIPVKPLDIKTGETAVIVTNEGPIGHVLKVKKTEQGLVSVTEGNHSVGVGRIVEPTVIKGEVSL